MTPLIALWQFGNPAMLAWGAAAALPILIHLWSRQKHAAQRWAAMSFLLAAVQKNARRLQLQQWILLAVRMAVLAFFALAVADPRSSLLDRRSGAASGQTHVILVIDGSYSMGYRQGGQSRFEAAKQWARQLVNGGPRGDGYTLVLMTDPPQVVIGQPAFERRAVLDEIDGLALSHGGASLAATLAQIETLLHESARQSASGEILNQRRIFFLTDLQQATWGEVNSSNCKARLSRLESLATLELVDLSQPGDTNLAVARLAVDSMTSGPTVVGSDVQLQTDVQNPGDTDCWRVPVEWYVDGQRIAEERLDCKARGRATVVATHRFTAPGEHIIEVRLKDDVLPFDNRRWLVVPVHEAIRVLCIGGRPGETKHVAMALAPHSAPGQAIEVISAPESRLLEGDLAKFDCLIVSNIGHFTREEGTALHRFASRGGGLVVFLGNEVQVENYNQLLIDEQRSPLLPARLDRIVPAGNYLFDPLEYRHPIVAPFRGFPKSGLLTTPVWKYVRATPLEGSHVALAFNNGDPAVVEGQVGRGRCILVATAASPDAVDRNTDPPTPWTALATWPSFPPLIHEILRWSIAVQVADRNVLVGEALSGTVPANSTDTTITLSGPSGIHQRVPIRLNNGVGEWSFPSTSSSGIYEAETSASTMHFAVNVNPREGDLSRFDVEQLPAGFHHELATPYSDAASSTGSDSVQYFRWLLGAVLALLVIEPCLAWRFGRGRR